MANLTLVVDDGVLKAARLKALTHDTSVNAVVRDFLEAYVEVDQRSPMQDFLDVAASSRAGQDGVEDWSRDDLHER